MKTANVCFFWHMHQPYYTDPVSRTASMPWVRLHAIKAYYDMPLLLERFPAVRATFNLTPSLLRQLQEAAGGSVKDLFLEYAERPAADLTLAERVFIIRHFFAVNWGTMVRPFPRYHELLVKRGTNVALHELERIARQFSTQELLDLQVWHNLAWFGYAAVARYPRLQELRGRARGFSEEDKHEVLGIQRNVLNDIIPTYRRLADRAQIELTTTPYYHPILPLVMDTDFARRARPDATLPHRLQAADDAEAQLRRAVEQHTELFGSPPRGLWPSEGSVCPEIIPLLHRVGIRWFASDEEVLARSQRAPAGPSTPTTSWDRPRDLYRPYLVDEHGIRSVFRDRELSDAFGFVYSKATPETARDDVLRRLGQIMQQAPDDQLLIPIILDGENPWEHYHDGGERFLAGLYAALSKGEVPGAHGHIQAETLSRAIESHPRPGSVTHLHSGSWINADFKIWIGHPEDNRGWELVRDVRHRLLQAGLPSAQAQSAWDELYAAEGSDWFWWYGDDFQTDFKAEFDRLFRTHLRNALVRAGLPVPDVLSQPVMVLREPSPARMPVRLLSPALDGAVTDFFEWRGAGDLDPAPPLGAMWKSYQFFTHIAFGFSLEALFLRLDPGDDLTANAGTLTGELRITPVGAAPNEALHVLSFSLSSDVESFLLLTGPLDGPAVERGRYPTIRHRTILELAVPFKDLHLEPGQEFGLSLVVLKDGLEQDRYPAHAALRLSAPDRDFEARVWRV
jgi:alpha-amylase/alpha-mannosidase (GH57 family)